MSTHQPLLRARDLTVEFSKGWKRNPYRAVDGVDLEIGLAETVGLVGESGSGKSTIGNAILGLTSVSSGAIEFDGADITKSRGHQRRMLSAHIQAVFQDPYSSLNPYRRIGATIAEPLLAHSRGSAADSHRLVNDMLERVGLQASDAARFPNAFSGGQRQRIAIARALIIKPKLLVCDEAVSALDLSTQAQILNLLRDLQAELGMATLFISHDLAVVKYLCQRLVVLERGKIVESGRSRDVYRAPREAYTARLVAASPIPDPLAQRAAREARRAESISTSSSGTYQPDPTPKPIKEIQ